MQNDTTNELIEIMFKISRRMKEEMSFTNNLTHLSILQIQTLIFLSHNKNITMGDIAANFRIEMPSATILLNKLYEQQLVVRRDDPQDRRIVRISLTEIGTTLLKKAMIARRKKTEKMLSYLSETEKKDLLNILKTLNYKLTK